MCPTREALGTAEVSPALLTCAERIQYEGFLRREKTNQTIGALADDGMPMKAIVRHTACSRQVVRQILRGERGDVFRVRMSSLEPWLAELDREWTAAATAPNSGGVSRRPASRAACES
ncbi:MAG: hypothetical protein IT562_21925 [Alphaproteobacteria bacterium]|nr:hypothetical protein [Alphaproteobacteria bacterium]